MTTLVLHRRVTIYLGAVGALLVVIGGIASRQSQNPLFYVGAALGILAWLSAMALAYRQRSYEWLVTVLVVGLSGLPLTMIARRPGELVLLFLAPGVIAFAYGVSRAQHLVERSAVSALAGLSIVILILGGTIVGQSLGIGTAEAGFQVRIGTDIYLVCGVLAAIGWVAGIILAVRTQAWGWLPVVVLLVGIGAFMFAFFGPTPEDIRQARHIARERRAAGF